jgi:YfiH family protein
MIQSGHISTPGIAHAFFERGGGYSSGIFASLNCGLGSGDDPDIVRKNRSLAARQLAVADECLLTAWQIHSAEVVHVTQAWPNEFRPKADALVCSTRGMAIGILTADCAPILFADVEARIIGACHAGWKGALSGVTTATIKAMQKLGASPSRIIAVIGPTISQANYEVGPAFPDAFLASDPDTVRYFKPSTRPAHYMFDLPGYLQARLRQAGLEKVTSLGLCTYADEARFFSYRRATHRGETDYGRLLSAIALV